MNHYDRIEGVCQEVRNGIEKLKQGRGFIVYFNPYTKTYVVEDWAHQVMREIIHQIPKEAYTELTE